MKMSINSYNSNLNNKIKWKNEYKNLTQSLKDEELNLLKFFLINNYHLNKVYKKYVYKEMIPYNTYYENNYKKIKSYLNNFLSSYSFSKRLNNIQNFNNNNNIQKKKNLFKDLISSIKKESNKKYELLLKEEKEIINDLRNFDSNIISQYDQELDEWINEYNNFENNMVNTEINIENNKEGMSVIYNIIDRKKEKKNKILDNIKHFMSHNNSIRNSEISTKINDNFSGSTKSIQSLIGNLNIKKNCENIIRLTTNQLPKDYLKNLENSEDCIDKYIDIILKEIDYPNNSNSNSNINTIKSKEENCNLNTKYDEKIFLNNINIFLNKMIDDYKNINYLKNKLKYINNIIKEKMGGIYLGWEESEHKEFINLKNTYKDKSNSFIFLTSLNNLFPYMNVSELKRHIKLYDIYLKIEKIKILLDDKYTQMKNKFDIDKSRLSKQSSTSVTKSYSSTKPKYIFSHLKNKIYIDFEGNSSKASYFNNNDNFFYSNKKDYYKSNGYLRTNFNKNSKFNNNGLYKTKKNKENFFGNKNLSAILIKHSKNRSLNSSFNIYKKEKIKNLFNICAKNNQNHN